jgi:hypothetical protein
MASLASARSYTELLEAGEDDVYVFSRIFPTEGRGAKRRAKKLFALLRRIDEPLRAMLRDDERVSLVTTGVVQPSFLEWYLLGWAIYAMQRRAIVVTNRRMILMQVDSRDRPGETRNQIVYRAVTDVSGNWMGNVEVAFRNGSTAQLAGIPRVDRKRLTKLFERGFAVFDAQPARTGVEDLCPRCYTSVEAAPPACPSCGGAFKSARTARRLSLVFPGAGDLYLGHKAFAVFEIVIALILWAGATLVAFDPTMGVFALPFIVGFLLLFAHVPDAWTTGRIGRKGLLPSDGGPVGRRYAMAAAVPVVCLLAMASTIPGKLELRPLPAVVVGEQLPKEQLSALRWVGHVERDEAVRYFYSDGLSNILEDGNLFTDDRVVSYVSSFDSIWVSAARFVEVDAIRVVPASDDGPSGMNGPLTSIYVAPSAAPVFFLIVSAADGRDEEFTEALLVRWREARARAGGTWFDGGGGDAVGDAVLIRGLAATDAEELERHERRWLEFWLGEEDVDWTATRVTTVDEKGPYDVVTVTPEDGESWDVVFRAER